jgi:FtsP/CotA-like multicopper oxidase with cupredoxin domain
MSPNDPTTGRRTRLRRGGALLTLATLAGLATAPVPAQAQQAQARAQLPTAMERCLSGAAPNQSQTVTHHGNQVLSSFPDGADPGNAVWPGDVVKVTAIGSISPNLWRTFWVGPAGDGIPAGPEFPFPGHSEYSLVARWNNNGGGWVGDPMPATSLSGCVAAPGLRTRLLYYVNDMQLWDNVGAFTIRTDLYYGS